WIDPVHVQKLVVRLYGGERHPVERKQQNQKDDRKRQIKRHQPARERLQIAHALAVVGRRRKNRPRVGRLAGKRVSHCFRPAATSAAVSRTTKSELPPAGTGSSPSR